VTTGVITTFYSFKGGVGRSALLANVATLLSRWGFNVLCVDWDIEAPGLDEYFRPRMGDSETLGLVDLVSDFSAGRSPDWGRYVSRLSLPQMKGSLSVMSAGRPSDDYIARAQKLDWRALFDEQGFGEFLEELREAWKEKYDFVLVDSRTGITDIGGICTVHLPDLIVPVFTANHQSLDGVVKVLRQAKVRRDALPLNRAGLWILPVPSRIDSRVQEEQSKTWLRLFAEKLDSFYDAWLDTELTPRQMIDLTRVPYFSTWSFGERLATLEERENDPEAISYHYGTIAALIAQSLRNTEQLLRGRDIYVESARSLARPRTVAEFDFYLSYPRQLKAEATDVSECLRRAGQSAFIDFQQFGAGGDWRGQLEQGLANSRDVVFFVAPEGVSSWQAAELELARANASDGGRRRVIPLYFGNRSGVPNLMTEYLGLDARGLTPQQIADYLLSPSASKALGSQIDPELLRLATRYENVKHANYGERVRAKDALAEEMGQHVLDSRVSRDSLAQSNSDGLAVALASAVIKVPEPGDLGRLMDAGQHIEHLHAAYRLLLAVDVVMEKERIDAQVRERLLHLLLNYEKMALDRKDSPLLSLVRTLRRRLSNLT
jgi:MinD-like ATPase involved in chromosome partitioning or flagellar assembly